MRTVGRIMIVAGIALMVYFVTQAYWIGLVFGLIPIGLGLIWQQAPTRGGRRSLG